jgi:sulfur carrier protein
LKIKLKVNDEDQEVEANAISVDDLLEELHTASVDQVIVQVNEEFIEQKDFEKAIVADGDVVDILYSMGGGKV